MGLNNQDQTPDNFPTKEKRSKLKRSFVAPHAQFIDADSLMYNK